MDSCKGRIHSIESFGAADGPGVRFVAFMQGCRMRCRYCHNPETWSLSGGTEYTAEDLCKQALRYRSYWGRNMEKGGVTVSGGEPLLQMEFVTAFFKKLKEHNVHTAIDTAGQPFSETQEFLESLDQLLAYTDLVILDFKLFDEEEHKALTGLGNAQVLKMATYLSEEGIPMWIRHVLVPGITDKEQDLRRMAEYISRLKTVERVEVLPYHTLGTFKWENLKMAYPLEGVPTPTADEIKRAEEILMK